jgi:hypothetical protein
MQSEFAAPAAVAAAAGVSGQLLNTYCRALVGGELLEDASEAPAGGAGWRMWRRKGALQVVLAAALIRRGVKVRVAFDAVQDFFRDGGFGRDVRMDACGVVASVEGRRGGALFADGLTWIVWRDPMCWAILNVASGGPALAPNDLAGRLGWAAGCADPVLLDVDALARRVAAIFEPAAA